MDELLRYFEEELGLSRRSVLRETIFDWFEEDFEAAGGVRAFLAAHLPPPDAEWLRGPGRGAIQSAGRRGEDPHYPVRDMPLGSGVTDW